MGEISLFDKYNINEDINKEFKKLVNTKVINDESINRWYCLKESYSSELVEKILERYDKKNASKILDPFMGAGTTLYYSLSLGMDVYGFDVNPISVLISKVKTRKYNKRDIKKIDSLLEKFNKISIKEKSYPDWKPMERYIDKNKLNILLTYRDYILKINNLKIKELFLVLWLSTVEEVSNYKKDGNGIKKTDNNYPIKSIWPLFKTKIKMVKSDIISNYEDFENYGKAYIYEDSSMQIDRYKNINEIDVIITSPPYANSFDYFEVYKMELWLMDYIKNYSEWREYKKTAMRNNMNADLNEEDILDNSYFKKIIKKITNKVQKGEIRERRVPIMLNNYFFDMKTLLKNVKPKLNNDAIISIVVGNSAYGGTVIPTDKIIIDIANNLGYDFIELIKARKLRTSPQQMKIMSTEDKNLLRESIIILKNKY